MSRTAVIRAVAAFTAVMCTTSCSTAGSRARNSKPDPTSPITINVSCDGNVSVGLVGANGDAGWVIKVNKKDPIEWDVPANVTIDGIVPKNGADPLPIDPDGPGAPQGHSKGTPWKSRVRDGGPSDKDYGYTIQTTCTPTTAPSAPPVQVVIDPVMIVH